VLNRLMSKRKIKLGEQEVNAEEIPFEVEREDWNTYILHDGTKLKLKSVLAEVLRVEGMYAPNGEPVYVVNASPVVSTNSPEQLKRK
jgi:hypothetical protein